MALDRLSGVASEADCVDELMPGTALFHGQYRITKFLNSGGFGITYLARDRLNRDVVLKECFADAFCRRSLARVAARSESSKAPLQKILRGFLSEAQILASLTHPNIVRVHQVFEDNDTAYMALDYISGHDLLEIIDEKKVRLAQDQIVAMARKLISAVGHIHDQQLLHCDLSPDNICVRPDGEPVVIDFGSARTTAMGSRPKHTGLSMVKDGYSPHELYRPDGPCGPWSDFYALGASLYHAISGAAPADSQTRLSALIEGRPDPVKPLAGNFAGYPAGFLASIDKAMSVQARARHQSAQDWLRAIAPPPQVQPSRNMALIRRVVVVASAARQAENRAAIA